MALPNPVTAGVTTGHAAAHNTIHALVNRFDTAASPAAGQVPVFDAASGLYKPGLPSVNASMLAQDARDSIALEPVSTRAGSWTVGVADFRAAQHYTGAADVTVTFPSDAADPAVLPGMYGSVALESTAVMSFAAGAGAVLRVSPGSSRQCSGQYGIVSWKKVRANEYWIGGDLATVSAAPFAPSDIAGLGFWLDAASLGLQNGAPVSSWASKAGTGGASQATTTAQPIMATAGPFGRPSVQFDGSTDYFDLSGSVASMTNNSPGLTVFAVAQASNLTAGNYTVLNINGGTNLGRVNLARVGTTMRWGGRRLDTDASSFVSSAATDTAAHIYTGVLDTPTAKARLLAENAIVASTSLWQTAGSFSATDGQGVRLGANGSGTEFWAGWISELLMWPRVLSDAEQAQVYGFLASKYGLA